MKAIKESKPEMATLNGWLYLHFDSRGGTTMVIAPTREEADRRYIKEVFMYDDEMVAVAKQAPDGGFVEEDFSGTVTLHHKKGVDLKGDLEWYAGGHVILAGTKEAGISSWPPTEDDDDEWEEEVNAAREEMIKKGHLELEYVAKGDKPVKFKEWLHPRWDDNAFSFCIHDLRITKKIVNLASSDQFEGITIWSDGYKTYTSEKRLVTTFDGKEVASYYKSSGDEYHGARIGQGPMPEDPEPVDFDDESMKDWLKVMGGHLGRGWDAAGLEQKQADLDANGNLVKKWVAV